MAKAVVRGMRLKLWNTNPIFRFRTTPSAKLSSVATGTPSRKYWPSVGWSKHPMMCIKVLLPLPEAPMIARYSPCAMSMLTPRSAWTVVALSP